MDVRFVALLAILAGCSDQATSPPPTPAPVPSALVRIFTFHDQLYSPDTVIAEGDSIVIIRSIPRDSCCLDVLRPTLTLDDSAMHVELVSPVSPHAPFAYVLRLETVIRRGVTGPLRLTMDLRYPGAHPYADTIRLPPVPAATDLPPLQLVGTVLLGEGSGWSPDTFTTVAIADGVARLEGILGTGGWTPNLRMAVVPELTDSGVVLHLADEGWPFSGSSRINFAMALLGLPAGSTRVGLEYRGRMLDTAVVTSPDAP